jgi:hypothetical protein
MLLYSILIQFFLSFYHSLSLHLIFLMLHRYCTFEIVSIHLWFSLTCIDIISIQIIVCISITLIIRILNSNFQIVVRVLNVFNDKSSLFFFNFKFLQFILLLHFDLLLTSKSLLQLLLSLIYKCLSFHLDIVLLFLFSLLLFSF